MRQRLFDQPGPVEIRCKFGAQRVARRTRQSGMRDRKQRRRARGQVSQAAGRGPSPCCRTHRCTQRQAPCPPSRGVGRCAPRGPFNGVGMSARPVLNRRSRQRLVHGGTEGRIAGPCRSDGQQWGLARSPRTSRAVQKRPALLVGRFRWRRLPRILHGILPVLAGRGRCQADQCRREATCVARRGLPRDNRPKPLRTRTPRGSRKQQGRSRSGNRKAGGARKECTTVLTG